METAVFNMNTSNYVVQVDIHVPSVLSCDLSFSPMLGYSTWFLESRMTGKSPDRAWSLLSGRIAMVTIQVNATYKRR